MAELDALAAHLAKWRAQQPEMGFAEPFWPAAERGRRAAWCAVLLELTEAMFEIEDAQVARTKLAWWGEDLAGGVAGGRHPLTRALAEARYWPAPSSWRDLIGCAQTLVATAHRPADARAGLEELAELGEAIAALETGLLGEPAEPRAIALQLHWQRNLRGLLGNQPGRSRLPAPIAEAPSTADLRNYAAELRALAPVAAGGRLRACRLALDRLQLARLARTGNPARALRPAAATCLWHCWRAARKVFPAG